jgi:hypothetical protein
VLLALGSITYFLDEAILLITSHSKLPLKAAKVTPKRTQLKGSQSIKDLTKKYFRRHNLLTRQETRLDIFLCRRFEWDAGTSVGDDVGRPREVAGEPRRPQHPEWISGQRFWIGTSWLILDWPDLIGSPVPEPEGVAVARQRVSCKEINFVLEPS